MPYTAKDVRARDWVLRMLLIGPPKSGKSGPVDEPVLTPQGWRPMGTLSVGDLVTSSTGAPARVTGVFPQGTLPIFRVTTNDGSWARTSLDHLWFTTTRNELFRGRYERPRIEGVRQPRISTGVVGQGSVKTLREIRETLEEEHFLPTLTGPVQFQSRDELLIDPYVLGLLLGDGCVSDSMWEGGIVNFTSNDDELMDCIDRYVVSIGGTTRRYRYPPKAGNQTIRCRHLLQMLSEYRLLGKTAHTKSVPKSYLHASIENRLAMLQGLCDTDGHACRQVGNPERSTRAEFSSVSEELADDVVALTRSLGGDAQVRHKKTYCGEAWVVSLGFSNQTCPFRLRRKAERWAETRERQWRPRIDSVEAVGGAECVCIAVDAPDHLYVTRDYLLTHNTHCSVLTSPGPVGVLNTDGPSGLDPVVNWGGDFICEDVRSYASFKSACMWFKAHIDEINTLVFDNISNFARLLEKEARLTVDNKDGRAIYGEYGRRILDCFDMLLALPVNLVIIGHATEAEPTVGGFGHMLTVPGQPKVIIPAQINDWVWLDTRAEGDKLQSRLLLAPHGGWTSAARSIRGVPFIDANITTFIEMVKEFRAQRSESNGAAKPKPIIAKPSPQQVRQVVTGQRPVTPVRKPQ